MSLPQPTKSGLVIVTLLLFAGTAFVYSQEVELAGSIAAETRLFPESALHDEQFGAANFSLLLQPEFTYEWQEGYQRLTLSPFARLDQHDEERSHFDLREFYWEYAGRLFELRFGLRQIFWGVSESQHLVDIINQTDQVESLDGEDKLGQPMLHVSLIDDWGTLDAFLMSGFRERSFAGPDGRLRPELPIDTENAEYESSAEQWHLDWALRWSHYIDIFDFGLSHFVGTSREPTLLPRKRSDNSAYLLPRYELINQTGIELQATTGGWLLKLEAITRGGQGDRYYAAVGGFEYTFGDVGGSGIDIGVLSEYHYDDRGAQSTNPLEDDFFLGTRLAFNDVQSTDILAGMFIDRETGAGALRLEGARRLGDSYKLSVELNGFFNAPANDFFYGLRRDSFLQLELARYF